MKKLLLLLLTLSLLVTSLVACKNDGTPQDTGETETTYDPADELAALGLPADTNMQGKTFTVYNQPWNGYEPLSIIDIKPEDGEVGNIAESAYERALEVEEALDCEIINFVGETYQENGLRKIQTAIASGDCPYDILMIRTKQYLALVTSGYLTDISDIPYLNLTKEWWDTDSRDALALGKKAYAICSDMTINDDLHIANIYFNKQMVEDYSATMESPYALVDSDRWTFEAMYDMAKQVASHPDDVIGVPGNTAQDIYGFGYVQDAAGAFLNAFGVNVCTMEESGTPVYSLGGDLAITKMQKLMSILLDTNTSINFHARLGYSAATTAETETFLSGRELFCIGGLYYASNMRRSETEFGIIPFPKYNTDQTDYITPVYSASLSVCAVPVTNGDMDNTGIFMEYFAYKGNQYMRPALYDELLEGYLPRDEESLEMLDIIFETVRYDCGMIFNFGGVVDNIFNQYNGLNESTVKSNATIWGISLGNEIKNIMATLNR
ncbi:MAG: extracellular solute-binding protein [Clostridia bacterium]|nr:extracellular solute-binding protein [Clostridia bacterium]